MLSHLKKVHCKTKICAKVKNPYLDPIFTFSFFFQSFMKIYECPQSSKIIAPYLLVIIFFPFNIFLGYVYLSPILTVFTPPHWCYVPDLMNLTMKERKKMAIPLDIDTGGGYSQCRQYITDWSKVGQVWYIKKKLLLFTPMMKYLNLK